VQAPIRLRVDLWATEVSGIGPGSATMRDGPAQRHRANGNTQMPSASQTLSVSHLGDQGSRFVHRPRQLSWPPPAWPRRAASHRAAGAWAMTTSTSDSATNLWHVRRGQVRFPGASAKVDLSRSIESIESWGTGERSVEARCDPRVTTRLGQASMSLNACREPILGGFLYCQPGHGHPATG
jgi:hypothetical protein